MQTTIRPLAGLSEFDSCARPCDLRQRHLPIKTGACGDQMLTLIKNAHVYAPQPLGLCNILIAGGKIVYLGTDLPILDACLDVSKLDVGGACVVPGFIDAHAHITGGGGETGPASRVPPVFLAPLLWPG